MVKLTDVFNTKYFPLHYTKDLQYFVRIAQECLEDRRKKVITIEPGVKTAIEHFRERNAIEIDIAGAHFVRETISVLQNCDAILLCDTENLTRDGILNENRRRARLDYETTPVPSIASSSDIPEWIDALECGAVYVAGGMPIQLFFPLVTLTTIFRPEVQFDMEGQYDIFFEYVERNVNLDPTKYSTYNVVVSGTLYQFKFHDDIINIPGVGDIDYNTFHQEYTAMPIEFGTKDVSNNEDFQLIQTVSIDDVIAYFRSQPSTITDIFKKRG